MAMEPIYWALIVVLATFVSIQYSTIIRWRKAANYWRSAAQQWRRLASDYEHHRVGRAHVSNVDLAERTEDQ